MKISQEDLATTHAAGLSTFECDLARPPNTRCSGAKQRIEAYYVEVPREESAREVGVNYLYKYQPFEAGRLADVLDNHRVYCSDPTKFNDPWDCKPFYDMSQLDDPVVREKALAWIDLDGSVSKSESGIKLLSDTKALQWAVQEAIELSWRLVPQKWGIYCLARHPDTTLMWSHYASNHTGICLEFAVQETRFRYALKVQYEELYPPFGVDRVGKDLTALITKSDVWKYEDEFRLICSKTTELPGWDPLTMTGNYLAIEEHALRAVIVGCQGDYEQIQGFVGTHAPHIPVRRAVRIPNKYRLEITPAA